jgi:hypothetical protein
VFFVLGKGGGQNFDGHISLQSRITRPVHLAHAASPN